MLDNKAKTLKLKSAVRGTLQPQRPAEVNPLPANRCAARRCTALAAASSSSALALAVAPARAEQADREKPINFSGDTGDVNYETRGGTLKGNVVITQGTLSIRADRIDFKQNADNSLSATAFGNPVAFRQKRDGVDDYYEGCAQRAEYDGAKELLELFDRALLKRGAATRSAATTSPTTPAPKFQGRRPARRQRPATPTRSGRARARHVPAQIRTPMPGKDDRQGARTRTTQGQRQGMPPSRRRRVRTAGDAEARGRPRAAGRQVSADAAPASHARRASSPRRSSRSATRRARSSTTSRSTSRAARSSACSARTAPARRRAST